MNDRETLSSSLEDYLEAIYHLVTENGCAKVTEISNILNVKKASVTGALNALVVKKLINYEPYSSVTLTQAGEKAALEIIKKHETMCDFFVDILKMSKQDAAVDACKMEHIISETLFERVTKFSLFIRDYSAKNPKFQKLTDDLFN